VQRFPDRLSERRPSFPHFLIPPRRLITLNLAFFNMPAPIKLLFPERQYIATGLSLLSFSSANCLKSSFLTSMFVAPGIT
jgi:hypothetical protein